MPLQFKNIAVGNLQDDVGGNNYAANKAVYILNLNNTLAQIFSDEAGATPIVQDGVNNVTNSKGVFGFWVEAGDYFVQVGANKYRVSITGADYFNNRVDETVNLIVDSVAGRGAYYVVGSFEAGFTYTDINQVGTFGGTDYYVYTGGLTNLPHTVAAGTVPSAPDYQQVIYSDHSALSNRNAVGAHDIYTRTFNTVSDMKIGLDSSGGTVDMAALVGHTVECLGYYQKGDGGGNKGVVKSGAHSDDFGSKISIDANTYVEMELTNKVNSRQFGVIADGVVDDTERLQKLLDYLDSVGGGVCQLSKGTFNLAMANSVNPYACLLIPRGVTIRGRGKTATKIQRLPSERGVNGVLIANKNYDTLTNYTADGDIVIECLTIDEGAATPTKSLGDLIGFGNGDGLTVRYCHFGNHDQHAIDIARSRNVDVYENTSNNQVNATESATYQIDAGLIWGIAGSSAKSYNVNIHNNRIFDTKAARAIHFHSAETAENVHIHNNLIDCVSMPAGGSAIAGDGDINYSNTHIHNNEIILYNLNHNGIYLPSNDTVSIVENLHIYKNSIKGTFKRGIYVGDSSPTLPNTNGPLRTVYIKDNFLECSITAGNVGDNVELIASHSFKYAEITDNTIELGTGSQTQTGWVRFINDGNNENVNIDRNRLVRKDSADFVSNGFNGIYSDFSLHHANNLRTIKNINDNFISINNADYHIIFHDVGNVDSYVGLKGVVSRNRMIQTPKQANMKEILPLSDGTNNLGYVDFVNDGAVADDRYVLPISQATFYANLPMTGTKQAKEANRRTSKTTLDVIYSPLSANGFGNDTETISNVYISPSQNAGLVIKDVDNANGNFDIVTGSDGVSMVINDSNFSSVLRTSGFIKVLCGI